MNIYLLKSMFAGNVGTQPTPLKPVTTSHTNNTVTTDNTQSIAQNEYNDKPSENFNYTLGKKITTEAPLNAQLDKKTKKQDQGHKTLSETIHHPANSTMVQGQLTQPVVLDEAANAKILNQFQQQVGSQTHGKTVRLIASSKALNRFQQQIVESQTHIENQTHGKTVRLIAASKASSPDQIVSATSKPANEPIQPTIKQGHIKSEIVLPTASESLLIAKAQSEKGKDTGKLQASDKASVSESPKIPETNKTAITSTLPSNQQNQQSSKESTPQTPVSDSKTSADSEQSAVTNKPFAPDSSKTQLSNIQTTAPDQSSLARQKVSIGQETPTQAAEETTPSKADTNQKNHRDKAEFFEVPKRGVHIEPLSVKSATQKMSQPQVQSSVQQVENHNSLLSNNTSNPVMEPGEQVLLGNGNNAQPVIAEQSPASAASTKIAGNADSGASVGSQIQESIHSSFHSGSQQIVIRLNPPELGKVAIKFSEQGDDITGLLQVDKLQTRDQIQQVLPEIIQNLQDSGVQIKRLEVVLTNQQEQHTSKDQSSTAGQDSFSEQQNSSDSEPQRNNTTYNEWLRSVDNVTEFTEAQVQLTDSSINMLV